MDEINQQEEKPLLTLMKSLVSYIDNEEKAVLTNPQLLNILYKELNVDIFAAHPLELEVYNSILKKFLKLWPNWERVGQYAQNSKIDADINIEAILNEEYKSLRKYLQEKIDLSKDITKENVAKAEKILEQTEESTTNVVLNVNCSRAQLNKLFFTQPNPQLDNTIFNIDRGDSKIKIQKSRKESLFNWPNLTFNATIGPYEFTRINKQHYQHTLINKKLNYKKKDPPKISQQVHSRVINNSLLGSSIERTHAIKYIQKIIKKHLKSKHSLKTKFLFSILNDLVSGPTHIDQGNEYMYFPSQHAYVRYLSSDVKPDIKPTATMSNSIDYSKYLLQLEEIIIPSVMFKLRHNSLNIDTAEAFKTIDSDTWIKSECLDCNEKFESFHSLEIHVVNFHCDEPDVECMNCKKKFSWGDMAFNCWRHICVKL